jgi:hypothetical protein
MRRSVVAVLALALFGCPLDPGPKLNNLTSFQVTVLGVFQRSGATRAPLAVAAPCVTKYGSAEAVPAEVKGTPACRYVIPRGEVEFDVKAVAMGLDGKPITDWNGSVAYRVVPGDLVNDLRARWTLVSGGEVTTTIRALHPYGEVRVWIEDSPPKALYDGGVVNPADMPPDVDPITQAPFKRTYAAGASDLIYFSDQTLQSLQLPAELDNRSSPFTGEFVLVGRDPSAGGETVKQTCADDPRRNGADALMVVTGLDPSGFFVTDISACRLKEVLRDSAGASVRTPEPPQPCWLSLPDGGQTENLDGGTGVCGISEQACRKTADCPGYSPGTFASMFIYNYNFPDGLDEGDLLFTLSGAVQEFTSTTQMVFPAWSVAERVRRLPEDQWNKWLQFARPYDINARTCGQDNAAAPFLTDSLCGHNRRNMKMESLESGLVKLRRVRFPQRFINCDANANGSVPFFCETTVDGVWQWSTCSFDAPEPEADRVERVCHMNCVVGMGDQAGVICSEEATFKGFGQYVVELAPPGLASAGLDEALPLRMQRVTAPAGGASTRVGGYGGGQEVAITCSASARWRAGDATVAADDTATAIEPGQVARYTFSGSESAIAIKASGADATCTVGLNAHARINLITKDAVPELNPDCREDDPDADKAKQCRNLRGAEFNVIGHLRHVQPARPRWVVIPRAPDDVCCYPGQGLECPRPIKPCP